MLCKQRPNRAVLWTNVRALTSNSLGQRPTQGTLEDRPRRNGKPCKLQRRQQFSGQLDGLALPCDTPTDLDVWPWPAIAGRAGAGTRGVDR
eukprot:gene9997-13376_t